MRKLGCHQSVCFFAPPEVHQEILAIAQIEVAASPDSADVIHWSCEQSCRSIDILRPLWLVQGLEYRHRERLSSRHRSQLDSEPSYGSKFLSLIQEPEGKPLEEMYGNSIDSAALRSCLIDETAQTDEIIQRLLSACELKGTQRREDWTLEQEQERELEHEVEEEKESETPPATKALHHSLHPAVKEFILHGTLSSTPPSPFILAFDSLRCTSAYRHLNATFVHRKLFVTNDFFRTVESVLEGNSDLFLRPVKWVLSHSLSDCLVIISPFEANALLLTIEATPDVGLHLYSANTTKTMHSFSNFKFLTVPSNGHRPITSLYRRSELDLFAGSVFFEDYPAYKAMCEILGIQISKTMYSGRSYVPDASGYVKRCSRDQVGWPAPCPFNKSPIEFLAVFFGIRRLGSAYAQTHIGHLLAGRLLTKDTFAEV